MILHTKSFNIRVSIELTTLAHMLNVNEICLIRPNNAIFNVKDFKYWLCTSVLECFGQLVSPPCHRNGHQLKSKTSNYEGQLHK